MRQTLIMPIGEVTAMKKYIVLLLSILCILLSLSSCNSQKYSVADKFDYSQIDNSFNNTLSGTNLAYLDNTLYCIYYINNYQLEGIYSIDNSGCYKLIDGAKDLTSIASINPSFYNHASSLYMHNNLTNEFFKLDKSKNEFISYDIESIIGTNVSYGCDEPLYWNDDLIIYYTGEDKKLAFVKEGRDEVKVYGVTGMPTKFYPYNNTLYMLNGYGWLYKTDMDNDNGRSEYLGELCDNGSDFLLQCADYLYFVDDKLGLSRYSLKSEKVEQIIDCDVKAMNTYDNVVYYSSDDGFYSYNASGEIKKLTDLNAEEIYIFDTQWIYLYNTSGNIYRVAQDGSTVERVNIDTSA